mgnify:CR=1 FL=1
MWGLLCCLLHFEISFGYTLVQFAFAAVQHGGDNLIHVVILVLTQASAEDDLRLGVGQLLVLGIQCAVFSIVDGVIRLVTGLPLGGILAADDRFGQVVSVLVLAELEPFVLDDAGPRRLAVRVVDGGVAWKLGLSSSSFSNRTERYSNVPSL